MSKAALQSKAGVEPEVLRFSARLEERAAAAKSDARVLVSIPKKIANCAGWRRSRA